MTLKTLKDLKEEGYCFGYREGDAFKQDDGRLKAEAIKWVKEDIEIVKNELPFGVAKQIVNNWIKRFELTEEDLK